MTVPKAGTLAKYGLSRATWLRMYKNQRGKCAVCKLDLTGRQTFVDHQHVSGFSRLDDRDKLLYVRGILCYMCNRFRVCKNTLDSAKAVVLYLQAHHDRQGRAK